MDDCEEIDETHIFGDFLHRTEEAEEDGNFAQPIEDEDLFGGEPMEAAEALDDIFQDDYESDPETNNFATPNTNATKNYTNPVQLPSPAQIKKKLFNERVLEQAKAMALKVKHAKDFVDTNSIFITVDQDKLASNQSSKFFFNKLFNASGKSNKSPEKSNWNQLSNKLRLDICTQKRKVWDSFQQPATMLDEDEEIYEVSQNSPEADEVNQNSPEPDEVSLYSPEPDEVNQNSPERAESVVIDEDENEKATSPAPTDSSMSNDDSQGGVLLINSDESSNDSNVGVRRTILDDDDDELPEAHERTMQNQQELDL